MGKIVSKELLLRIVLIALAWVLASGGLIKGYYYIAALSLFVGIWLIAMPDRYKKGQGRMAWSVVVIVFAVLCGLLYWRGSSY